MVRNDGLRTPSTDPVILSTGSGNGSSGQPLGIEEMWKRLISIVASPEFTDWPAVSSEGRGSAEVSLRRERRTRRWCVFRVVGHGVSRCPRIDTEFPFLLPGLTI